MGKLRLNKGVAQTPCFMPVATRGVLKSLTPDDLEKIGAQIILSNTYHLMQRPGIGLIKKAGGLHKFMNWRKPILTDSGGFQVFSLGKFRKIKENGAEFRSEIDGEKYFLTPEKIIKMQINLGVDIAMALDICTEYPCSRKEAKEAVRLTTKWAETIANILSLRGPAQGGDEAISREERSDDPREKHGKGKSTTTQYGNGILRLPKKQAQDDKISPLIFAIIQGSTYKDLREESISDLIALNFDGYALGGECGKDLYKVADWTLPKLQEKKPRYLMGIGKPDNIVESVKRGADMFDCVMPARLARHGVVFIWDDREKLKKALRSKTNKAHSFKHEINFYKKIKITNAEYSTQFMPLDKNCECLACKNFTKGYIHHLFRINDPLALRLTTIHNLKFWMEMMNEIRKNI